MYYYIYRVSNKLTNMHYYGSRGGVVPPHQELGISYFSSSEYLIRDIKKFGKDVFKFKVIKIVPTRICAYLYENKLQCKMKVVTSDNFYNKTVCYKNFGWMCGKKHTPETISKIRKSILKLNSTMTPEELSKKYGNFGKDNPFYGKKHLPEVIEYIRNFNIGKFVGKDNPFYGKKHTPEMIEHISKINSKMVTVEMVDGVVYNNIPQGNIGSIINMSISLGNKLMNRSDLWEKYKIKSIEVTKHVGEKYS